MRRLAATLREQVAELPEGARLPSIRELCDRYGLSTTTVRNALSLLAAEGLVEPRTGAGYFTTGRAQEENRLDAVERRLAELERRLDEHEHGDE